MTATYQKHGLDFLYPENWKLTDESDGSLPYSISLETPDGDALWSLHIYPEDADPDEILKETVSTLQETYSDLEIAPAESTFEENSSSAIETLFYCLDFLVRVRLQVIQSDGYQLLLWFQAEDREFENREPIFLAITTSLLNKK